MMRRRIEKKPRTALQRAVFTARRRHAENRISALPPLCATCSLLSLLSYFTFDTDARADFVVGASLGGRFAPSFARDYRASLSLQAFYDAAVMARAARPLSLHGPHISANSRKITGAMSMILPLFRPTSHFRPYGEHVGHCRQRTPPH